MGRLAVPLCTDTLPGDDYKAPRRLGCLGATLLARERTPRCARLTAQNPSGRPLGAGGGRPERAVGPPGRHQSAARTLSLRPGAASISRSTAPTAHSSAFDSICSTQIAGPACLCCKQLSTLGGRRRRRRTRVHGCLRRQPLPAHVQLHAGNMERGTGGVAVVERTAAPACLRADRRCPLALYGPCAAGTTALKLRRRTSRGWQGQQQAAPARSSTCRAAEWPQTASA